MIIVRPGQPGSELPAIEDITTEDAAAVLNPEAKDVPELRPNTWLEEQKAKLEKAESGGNVRETAVAKARYAFSLNLRDAPAAYRLAEQALETGRELNDAEIMATAGLSLGWSVWNRDNDIRKALDYAVDAEYLFHDLGCPAWEAQAMLPRALAAWYAASYSSIPSIIEAAIALLREPAQDIQEHVRLRTYSSIFRLRALIAARGRSGAEQADRNLVLAVAYARAAPEPLLTAHCHDAIGRRLLAEKKYSEARRHFIRYGLIARRNNAGASAFDSTQGLVHTYTGEKSFPIAHRILAEADKQAMHFPFLPRLTRLRLEGARIDLLMEEGRWDEAESAIKHVMPSVEDSPRSNRVVTLKWLLRIYREKGTLTEHIDLYERLLEETNQLADERNSMQIDLMNTQQETERRKSEKRAAELLRGILPEPIYHELLTSGESAPRYHPNTVLFFSDFAGFTKIASALSPRQVIEELSDLFNNFDSIMAGHGCHRIETIGDAYVAAAGMELPEGGQEINHNSAQQSAAADAALRMVRAAIDIRNYLSERCRRAEEIGGPQFIARIGIHAGPIIGGIVGRDRIRFGIFGDAVNTAKRLEEACKAGSILVSETVHDLISSSGSSGLRLIPAPPVHAKGKGELQVWTAET